MKKKMLSILLAACMMFGLLPSVVWASYTADDYGDFSVTYDTDTTEGPNYNSGTRTLTLGNGIYIITGTGTATTDKIVVSSGKTADITLSNVNIDVSGKTACAFDMRGATVYLTLLGTNKLKSATARAGLCVPPGASLIITAESTGSLEATSDSYNGIHYFGAGIGGNAGDYCGNVTINGGTITATGGGHTTGNSAAGIGGSNNNGVGFNGGTVTINGGFVTANGVYNSAGIGGGGGGGYPGGAGGTVTINGGTVVATGGDWRGPGIGGGGGTTGGAGAEVTINGGSVKATGGTQNGAVAIGAGSSESSNNGPHGTLKNIGGAAVQLYTLTLPAGNANKAVTSLTTTPALGFSYGMTDVKTDSDGKLYVYLPSEKTAVRVTTTDGSYVGAIAGNAAMLTEQTYTVSGTVHKAGAGVGAPGLTVNLYAVSDTGFANSLGNTITNESGRYTIGGVSAGSYRARVEGVYGSHAASVSGIITVSDMDVTGPTTDMALAALTTKSIAMASSSHKTEYRVGEPLDVTNLKITVTRSDNSTYEKDVTTGMVSGFDSATVTGNRTLTITFDDKTTTYTIFVSRAAYQGDPVNTPGIASKTDTQVVLHTVIVPVGQTAEYSKSSTTTAPTAPTDWQDSTTFTGLAANTDYYFFARVKQTETVEAGGVSPARSVTTKRSSGSTATPAPPTIGTGADKPTSTSITIATVAGNEYYISTSNTPPASWLIGDAYFKANSNGTHKFYIGLSPATKYYIHVRVAETETAMPSASNYTARYTLPVTPSTSVVTVNYAEERINFANTYEVSSDQNFLDNSKAVVSGGTIQPETQYFVRVKVAGSAPASEAASFTTAARPGTPAAVLEGAITKTHNTISIASTVSAQQYSVDNGANWTLGNGGNLSFSSLTENHEYSIVTRIRAISTAFASVNSAALSVTTKTAPAALADSGVSYSVKDGTITGLDDTYEYSLDGGSTWLTTPTNVTFAVGNTVQVRTRETDTAMPSEPQTLGTVPALSAAPAYDIDYAAEKTTAAVPAAVEYNTSSAAATTWTAGGDATLALTPGTTYYFRVAATDAALAGNVHTLAVPARPDAPVDTAATIAAGDDASHTAIILATTYEYILADTSPAASQAGTAGTGSAAEVAATSGQHVYVRQKAVANTSLASDWVDCGEVVLGIDSITLNEVAYDVSAGTLTGTTENMEYQVADGDWTTCTAPATSGIAFAAGTVKVRQKDKPTNEYTLVTLAAAAASDELTLDGKTYNSVTLTAMPEYEYSMDDGETWQDDNVFSGLSASTAYSFVARIKATATTLPGTISTALSVTTESAPSGGGTSTTGAPVIVDGKTQNIGTEKKDGDSTTVTVDQSKLGENIGGAAVGSSVVVPVSENGTATAALMVKNIEDMAAKGMTLTVQTGSVAYNLNTSAIDTAALEAAFPGADMSTVPFNVSIQNSAAHVEGETLVLAPVAFTVTATYNGQTVSVDTFSAYIDRVIEVTAAQAAKITTAVVVSADGSVRHVPTNVIEKDGRYYAVVSSRTNSTYALIQNEVTFADAKGKWYEATVNEMGSRKIIAGRGASLFDGEASITRAEFAAILIRALGLPAEGVSSFADIPADAWYTGAVATAAQYGIVSGKGENTFDPSASITRQEAMLMLQRAALLTEFTGSSGDLGSFADAGSVGDWARDAAKWSVGSGLIQGADGKLCPAANITRAESAAIILRLLQKAELVDVRSKT